MKTSIGPLSMDLPNNWNDRTVYTFVAPRVVDPRQSPHLRMRAGFRENIAIHFERVGHKTSSEEYLQRQIDDLEPKLQKFRLLYQESCYIGMHPAHQASYQFSLRGQRFEVCQLRVVSFLPRRHEMLVFTGTAAAHVFENKKRTFWQILQSIDLTDAI